MRILRVDENTIDIRLGTDGAQLLSQACSLASEHQTVFRSANTDNPALREFLYAASALFELMAVAAAQVPDVPDGLSLDLVAWRAKQHN